MKERMRKTAVRGSWILLWLVGAAGWAGCTPHPRTRKVEVEARRTRARPQTRARFDGPAENPDADEAGRCLWESAGPGRIARKALEAYLAYGPGRLLKKLEIRRHPAEREKPFLGWKVMWIEDDCLAYALEAGDIIMTINGTRILRPADLWEVWKGLKGVERLEIGLRRGGKTVRLDYEVVETD
jgi:hypothetical protein